MKPLLSDAHLRDAIVKAFEDDPGVLPKHLTVTTIDGAVTLGGHVETYHEKHEAVRAAERVEGVMALADEIEVREPSLHERGDDEIAEQIAHIRALHTDNPESVGVQVRDGRVVLHGQIESESRREAIEKEARGLTGVRAVSNLIEVKPETDPPTEVL
jgi:osmotically-inducible protein OsmY